MDANLKHLQELQQQIDGDVLSDQLSRMLYATDASPYQRLPLAIVRPKNLGDCVAIMKFATQFKLPIIPRTAGTSLAGQCVGTGLVVDLSRYMTRIIEIDEKQCTAKVEPGVVCEHLNQAVQDNQLMFGPNPSTSKYCAIGGMVGNNAWGIHSQRYGTTRENVVELEALLSDGSSVVFGPLSSSDLQHKLSVQNLEGNIYRTIYEIINQHGTQIKESIPTPDGIHRNTGYPLDILIGCQPWNNNGPLFNLAPFLCGSEGTLVLVTAIKVKLVPVPQDCSLVCAHFHSIDDALGSVPQILSYRPAALEIVDHHILERTEHNIAQQANRFWLQGKPQAVLLIELHADYIDAAESVKQVIRQLRDQIPAYAYSVVRPPQIQQVWALRKAGLGLLMGMPGPDKAVTGIEDSAVPVADLVDYVQEIKALLRRYNKDCVIYGPAGRGTLHLRPELNLNLESERKKYCSILEEVVDIVMHFGGTVSAKHGDGRLRAPSLERVLGLEIISLLKQIKLTFDPQEILNPNKILDAPQPDSDLRSAANHDARETNLIFDWTDDANFNGALQKCNGAGVCLQRSDAGTMCPSYMVTREEKHGTRGRANILRQMLVSKDSVSNHNDQLIKEVLDLCIQCKACKLECPAGVDIARMKAEFMQGYNDRHGVSLRSRVIDHFANLSQFGSLFPSVANALMANTWVHRLLGFHSDCQLPRLAAQPFSKWWSQRESFEVDQSKHRVILVLDVFSNFYEPDIAKAAVLALEALNFKVIVTPCLSFGRIQISKGLLRKARKQIMAAVKLLETYSEQGLPIIGLEPSEILTLRDEGPDLFKNSKIKDRIRQVSKQTMLFEEFIADNAQIFAAKISKQPPIAGRILIHGHCHQKSLVGMAASVNALKLIPGAEIELIPSGCCGMAGAFGYQQEHFTVSKNIAELVLFPAIRKAPDGTRIVATGTSCRHQISDGLGIRAYHPAELFAEVLGLSDSGFESLSVEQRSASS